MRASVIVALALSAWFANALGHCHAQTLSTAAVAAEPAVREAMDAGAQTGNRLRPAPPPKASGARNPRANAQSARNQSAGDANLFGAAGCIVGEMIKGRAVVNAKSQCLSSGNLSAVTRGLSTDADEELRDADQATDTHEPGSDAVSPSSQRSSGRRQSRKSDPATAAADQAMRWAREQLTVESRSARNEPSDNRSVDLLVCHLSGRCGASESMPLLAAHGTRETHRPAGARASGVGP